MTSRRLLLLLLATATSALAQTAEPDSTLDRVVVTATRTAAALEDVAVPTTVIGAAQIEADGSLRLNDVLEDLPGLELTDGLGGTGIQIQGLDPAYTLILIDGQPVVGRTAGVLDVSRLSVRGIERVEVVRGPSSSLYGSDALAGVVNLVTGVPSEPALRLRGRAGSFGQGALALEAEGGTQIRGRAWGGRLVLDRTSTDGYDLDPNLFGNTTPERVETTADVRLTGELGPQTRARLGLRGTMGDDRLRFCICRREWCRLPDQRDGRAARLERPPGAPAHLGRAVRAPAPGLRDGLPPRHAGLRDRSRGRRQPDLRRPLRSAPAQGRGAD